MLKTSIGVLIVALATLVLELMLTRAFDVVLSPGMAYFVVTSAVFAFGLSGIYATVRPLPADTDITPVIIRSSVAFAISVALLIPLINSLPLDFTYAFQAPLKVIAAFSALYLAMVIPFFLAGYVLIVIFSTYASRIQSLYAWDLTGAGFGSILVVPLIPVMGPAGLMVVAAGLGLVAAALFSRKSKTTALLAVAGVVTAVLPLTIIPDYIEFEHHLSKRMVREDIEAGRREFVRWDPISLIYVVDRPWSSGALGEGQWDNEVSDNKAIQYDGGNQSSHFYPFDGDIDALRQRLDVDKTIVGQHFWMLPVLSAHYMKRDSDHSVLVIGSAGGQETKAALVYGAKEVDAVELVSSVVELGKGQYADYIGGIFQHPAVNVQAAEGRSFLRSKDKQYDIIQIFSNHTSSSIAQGVGAVAPVYLQTAEAYQEYFEHLAEDGILQINHHLYPRMITTAALAWKNMGRSDFQRHVAVYQRGGGTMLPTLLIKMQPWTAGEIDSLSAFLASPDLTETQKSVLVENPLDPRASFLSPAFYSGNFPDSLAEQIPMMVSPRTDDHPYFSFHRKSLQTLERDPEHFVTRGMALVNNASLIKGKVPMDLIHLALVTVTSVMFAIVFVFIPLRFSKIGRERGTGVLPLLIYFSCLGAGFIMIELTFIQKFMHLIGSPLYTYSTVIFTMLLAAGMGSASSRHLGISRHQRWGIAFAVILIYGGALIAALPWLFSHALALPTAGRVLVSFAAIFPLGFFLGMPFPLGILAIEKQPAGAVAWAWGMNGLFTVIGGLLSVFLSLSIGFTWTLIIALSTYVIAMLLYPRMRDMDGAPA